MLDNLFRGLFDSDLTTVISVTDFLLCMGFSLITVVKSESNKPLNKLSSIDSFLHHSFMYSA